MSTVLELEKNLQVKEELDENYIVQYSGKDWIPITISHFDVDDGGNLAMHCEVPFKEDYTTWRWDDGEVTSKVPRICNYFGYTLSEFRELSGETMWVYIKEMSFDDGMVDTTYLTISWKNDKLQQPPVRNGKVSMLRSNEVKMLGKVILMVTLVAFAFVLLL